MSLHKQNNAFYTSLQVGIALGSLVALSGTAAHAGLTIYDAVSGSSALLSNGVTTPDYSLGAGSNGTLPSQYPVTLGVSNSAKFVSTIEPNSTSAFEGFRNQTVSSTGGTYFDFPVGTPSDTNGTHLIDTFDATNSTPTGPLEIDFTNAVGAFGLKAQSSRDPDLETFTFSIYDVSNVLLGTYSTGQKHNDGTVGPQGKSLFIGAASTSVNISKVILSSASDASGYTGGSNDFYFGPLTVGDPVPEASTMTGFGLGTLFLGGLFLVSRKRKSTQTSPV